MTDREEERNDPDHLLTGPSRGFLVYLNLVFGFLETTFGRFIARIMVFCCFGGKPDQVESLGDGKPGATKEVTGAEVSAKLPEQALGKPLVTVKGDSDLVDVGTPSTPQGDIPGATNEHQGEGGRRRSSLVNTITGEVTEVYEDTESKVEDPKEQAEVEEEVGTRTRRLGFSSESLAQTLAFRRQESFRKNKHLPEGERSSLDNIREGAASPTGRTVTTEWVPPPTPEGRRPDDATAARIAASIKKEYLFNGLSEDFLLQVVGSMVERRWAPGDILIHQGSPNQDANCMYYIDKGHADVLVHGRPGEQRNQLQGTTLTKIEDIPVVQGNGEQEKRKVATKGPGEIFGEVALLFSVNRSADVVAAEGGADDLVTWALFRDQFNKLIVKHSQGWQLVQFMREVPLLQHLPDNMVQHLVDRIQEVTYKDGDVILKEGDEPEFLLILRKGTVKVVQQDPHDPKGGQIKKREVTCPGFVGDKALVTGMVNSESIIAAGPVVGLQLKQADFMAVQPLMQKVLDDHLRYTVLKECPLFKDLTVAQVEEVIDHFEEEHFKQGEVIVQEGEEGDKFYIMKRGKVHCTKRTGDTTMHILTYSGYSYFGERAILNNVPRAATLTAATDADLFSLSRKLFEHLLGPLANIMARNRKLDLLREAPELKQLTEKQRNHIVDKFNMLVFNELDFIIREGDENDKYYVIESGTVVVSKRNKEAGGMEEIQRLTQGQQFGEKSLHGAERSTVNVLAAGPVRCVAIESSAFEHQLGSMDAVVSRMAQANPGEKIRFADLEVKLVIGMGMFSSVRLVRHKPSAQVYALKCMQRSWIAQYNQQEHVSNERLVMRTINHWSFIRLMRCYRDSKHLYMLLELVQGGELFRYLDQKGMLSEPAVAFYASNVVLALEHLHSCGIIYRDLKPENLLIDTEGYLKMVDFGFAKKIDNEMTYTLCGTPDYQAPELILRKGHGRPVDFWSLGILVYEMLMGRAPFRAKSNQPQDVFKNILAGVYTIPTFVSDQGADLIMRLLQHEPKTRMACSKHGTKELRRHKFFEVIDWNAIEHRRMTPPHIPKVEGGMDIRHFDKYEDDKKGMYGTDMDLSVPETDKMWQDWDWVTSA